MVITTNANTFSHRSHAVSYAMPCASKYAFPELLKQEFRTCQLAQRPQRILQLQNKVSPDNTVNNDTHTHTHTHTHHVTTHKASSLPFRLVDGRCAVQLVLQLVDVQRLKRRITDVNSWSMTRGYSAQLVNCTSKTIHADATR